MEKEEGRVGRRTGRHHAGSNPPRQPKQGGEQAGHDAAAAAVAPAEQLPSAACRAGGRAVRVSLLLEGGRWAGAEPSSESHP